MSDPLSKEAVFNLQQLAKLKYGCPYPETILALLAERDALLKVADAVRAWEADDHPPYRLEQAMIGALADYDATRTRAG